MKISKYVLVLSIIALTLPGISRAESDDNNSGIRVNASVNIGSGDMSDDNKEKKNEDKNDDKYERDNKININMGIKRLDLQNKLFKKEMEDIRLEYKEARDQYMNAREESKTFLKTEFRMKFVERFNFAYEKLANFQTRMEARIKQEASAGVDTEKAQVKLDESVSFMADIKVNISSLKDLVSKEYSDSEKEAKKEEARKLVNALKADIKASHNALKEAFKELKSAKGFMVESNTEVKIENN